MNENRSHYKKHLSLDDRISIQKGLHDNLSLRKIALSIGKDPSTIPKEIKKHRFPQVPAHPICQKREVCSAFRNGRNCRYCADIISFECDKLKKSPYVCNGCRALPQCHLIHWLYDARRADKDYHFLWSDSRAGVNLNPDELSNIDEWLSPLIIKGQPISHIYEFHGAQLPFSKRTLYNYLDMGLFTARNIDLHRRVRYKKRRKRIVRVSMNRNYRKGRSLEDFHSFQSSHPHLHPVQMDTVIGRSGGKSLLTLFFPHISFMLIFLLPQKTQLYVYDVFQNLKAQLGLEIFQKLFPMILTDAGSEFQNPWILEKDSEGNEWTKIFYCDPYCAWQKGELERNHEFIRYVLPKGTSFDELTQEQILHLANHINSTARESLNGNTPFRLSLLLLNRQLHQSLGLVEIPPDEIQLNRNLLK